MKEAMNYCDICECSSCENARATEKRTKELIKIVDSWNWNCSPMECAKEIWYSEYSPGDFYTAMADYGLSDHDLDEVKYAYETYYD